MVAAVSDSLVKGGVYLMMIEILYLFAITIVMVALGEVIRNIKKK